jgi:hypothetical protein
VTIATPAPLTAPQGEREIQGRDYRQYRKPFALPDSATLAGTTFTGCRARVYHLLRITAERQARHPIGPWSGPPGWVPVFLLVEPWSGGSEGTRRARELRERYACPIEISDFEAPDGSESTTKLYRLAGAPIAAVPTMRPHGPRATPEGASRGTRTAATGPSPAPPSAPLAGVVFATRLLTPVAAREVARVDQRPSGPVFSGAFRCDPGLAHPLAPSPTIAARADAGATPEELDEMYRGELRASYDARSLERVLLGQRAVWIQATETSHGWTALRVLPAVLEALGARRLEDEPSTTQGEGSGC